MWSDDDDELFQNWERKSPEQRVDAFAVRIWENWFEKKPERHSLFFRLVQSLGQDAASRSSSPDMNELESAFYQINEFVGEAHAVATSYKDEGNPNFWRHRNDVLLEARQGKAPPVRREEAEGIADTYLRIPYRSQAADRMVIDMLVAGELFAFAQEVFNQRSAQRFWGGGPLSFLFGRGCTLVLAAFLGGFFYLLNWLNVLSDNALLIILLVIGGFFILESAWAVVHLPFAWRAQSKHNTRTAQLLGDMNGVYCELNSNGPISARHIRERAQAVSASGAVWPGPLFVLLEDVIERGGLL